MHEVDIVIPATGHSYNLSYWENDETYHWHTAKCEHITEKTDEAKHTFVNNICTECDYDANKYVTFVDTENYKIGLSVIINGEITFPEDITTNPDSQVYYDGWYQDLARTQPITDFTFDDDIIIYAKKYIIKKNLYSFTVNNGEATVVKSYLSEIAVFPKEYNGYPVTRIGADCCKGSEIQKAVITDNIKYIGNRSFNGCSNLVEVKIQGNNLIEIGEYAFGGCTNLTNITIPNGVTSIDQYAFYECTGLKSITILSGVISIGLSAFEYCTGLTSVIIQDSVAKIGDWAFSGCTNLTNITISDRVTFIGRRAFNNTAYYNNENNWENDVLYIGNHLISAKPFLSDNYQIKQGTITIGSMAFCECMNITSITLPDSVTSIGDYAFYNCSGLTSITIPDGVTSIGGSAFYGCKPLTSITIPDSITSIGGSAFSNTAYYNNEDNWKNGVLYIGKHLIDAKDTLSGDYQIKQGTLTIGGSAFYGCKSLTSITIPDSITTIDDYAFCNCSELTEIHFNGTKAQWNSITKISTWNSNTGNYTVYCTGGEIKKS
ncbi:MAG: leucine-rich repeat domain-containing protein [Roseburia sp.]|nr:leucine-rich repeat domain-containing protein [Roseburia sp.]